MNQRITSNLAKLAAVVAVAGGIGLYSADAGQAGAIAPVAAAHVAKSVSVTGDEVETGRAKCPEGYVATGGGVRLPQDSPVVIESDAVTTDGLGWEARVSSADEDDTDRHRVHITVVCAKGSTVAYGAGAKAAAR